MSNSHQVRSRDLLRRPFSQPFLKHVGAGIVVGFITGLVVGAFRWTIDQTLTLLTRLYPQMASHPLWLLPYLLLMIIIVLLLGHLLKGRTLDLTGSGVPQIEAILLGQHQMKWWSVLWRKFVGGLLVICPGLFLGREGPCIQMGACIGQGLSENIFHLSKDDRNILLQCGAAAGLAAAFSAPLAGTVFLLEEVTHNFRTRVWVPTLAACIAADFATFFYYGTKPCLYLPIHTAIPFSAYPWFLIIGVVIGAGAYGFQYGILNLHWWYGKVTLIPRRFHSIIPLVLVIPVGLWNANLLGGSHKLIQFLTTMPEHNTWRTCLGLLVAFLVIRFVGTMLSYGATVPGGIFMPVFVLGGIWGAIAGIIMIHTGIIPAACYLNMIVLGMTAYIAATEGTPFTSILLATEMVGSIEQILPMALLTFIAYYTSMALGSQPLIYDALRKEMVFEK